MKKGVSALNSIQEKIIDLKIERLRLERERAVLILNKGIIVYFVFLLGAIIGRINGVISGSLFNWLVILGLLILIISVVPYSKTMHREEDEIARMLDDLEG